MKHALFLFSLSKLPLPRPTFLFYLRPHNLQNAISTRSNLISNLLFLISHQVFRVFQVFQVFRVFCVFR